MAGIALIVLGLTLLVGLFLLVDHFLQMVEAVVFSVWPLLLLATSLGLIGGGTVMAWKGSMGRGFAEARGFLGALVQALKTAAEKLQENADAYRAVPPQAAVTPATPVQAAVAPVTPASSTTVVPVSDGETTKPL